MFVDICLCPCIKLGDVYAMVVGVALLLFRWDNIYVQSIEYYTQRNVLFLDFVP